MNDIILIRFDRNSYNPLLEIHKKINHLTKVDIDNYLNNPKEYQNINLYYKPSINVDIQINNQINIQINNQINNKIDIKYNNQWTQFLEKLKEDDCTLLSLYLYKLEKNEFHSLGHALKLNRCILNLYIMFSPILHQEYELHSWKDVLKLNTTLKNLNLVSIVIGNLGAQLLSEGLISNYSLEELNLLSNEIKDEGVFALSEALKVNQTLKVLSLAKNLFGFLGVKSIANMLQYNVSLEKLDISDLYSSISEVEDHGVYELCFALKYNTNLKYLYIFNENKIGYNGMISICELLKYNSTLKEIQISCLNFQEEEMNQYNSIIASIRSRKYNKKLSNSNCNSNDTNVSSESNFCQITLKAQNLLKLSINRSNFQN